MGKTFRDKVKAMNQDLNRDIKNLKVKKHITFHKASEYHGCYGKDTNRLDRKNTRLALRQEIW